MPPTPPSLVRFAARVDVADHRARASRGRSATRSRSSGRRSSGRRAARRRRRTPCRASPAPPRGRRAGPSSAATSARTGPRTVPGATTRRQDPGRDAEALEERARPVAGDRVQALARARDRVLGDGAAGQEVVEEVRPSSAGGRPGRSSGSPARTIDEQLVERVDGHELDARRGVDLVARARPRRRGPASPPCARPGSGPGSRGAGRGRRAARSRRPRCPRRPTPRGRPRRGRAQPGGHVAEQAQEVPVERARQR